jgi:adenylate cyclase
VEESRSVNKEAVRRAEKLLDVNPHNARVLSLATSSLLAEGHPERALEWARRAEAIAPEDSAVIINGALLRAQMNMKDEALDMLERVLGQGCGKRDWIENDPDYDPLREDPRFKAMMEKLS